VPSRRSSEQPKFKNSSFFVDPHNYEEQLDRLGERVELFGFAYLRVREGKEQHQVDPRWLPRVCLLCVRGNLQKASCLAVQLGGGCQVLAKVWGRRLDTSMVFARMGAREAGQKWDFCAIRGRREQRMYSDVGLRHLPLIVYYVLRYRPLITMDGLAKASQNHLWARCSSNVPDPCILFLWPELDLTVMLISSGPSARCCL
jgi:hypothetical protein